MRLTKTQVAALRAMAESPNGKINMSRRQARFRDSTICALENKGLALWCDVAGFEPQRAVITPAGRAALEG